MKRILVPCNFSPCSEKAIRFAVELAGDIQGEVIVLTVINDTGNAGVESRYVMEAASREAGLKFEELIKTFSAEVHFRHLIRKGKLLPAVLNCIKREDVAVVVMGTKGSRGWGEFFMGSNIEKVVRTSPVPVFAVKGHGPLQAIKNIIVPLNPETDSNKPIAGLITLQKFFKARLHLLHVVADESMLHADIRPQMELYAKEQGMVNYSLNVRVRENVREGIIQFARETQADMIFMQIRRNRDLKHLYITSVAADVVNHSAILTCTWGVNRRPSKTKLAPSPVFTPAS
jgi:nucleotide-binding universal stress UspA family protein